MPFATASGSGPFLPPYDITFCPGTPGSPSGAGHAGRRTGIGCIVGANHEAGRDEAGLKKAACFSMIERIVEIASSAETYLEEAEIDKKERKEIGAYFEETMKRLRHSKGKGPVEKQEILSNMDCAARYAS